MKCTHCGNTNLVKTRFRIQGDACLSESIHVYLCLECGHYEFFSPGTIESYKNKLARIRNQELEIEQLNKELEELQAPSVIQNIQDEIDMLEKKLKSLDITIRQQQKFNERVYELRNELRMLPEKIRRNKSQIENLQSRLKFEKSNFENGNF